MLEEMLALAWEKGADLAGWAALDRGELVLYSLLDAAATERFRSALVLGKKHDAAALVDRLNLPTERYDQDYRRLNRELQHLIAVLSDHLRAKGVFCQPVAPSETLDQVRHRGLISHRALAERAGLGVRGRNNLLVTIPFHSGIRLASILTELAVPRVPEVVLPYPCVQCNSCRDYCPVKALGENPSDFRLDLCLSHLERIQREELSPEICGICMAVCPGVEQEDAALR